MNMKKTLLAAMAGNALEWYDFALYGHVSYIISNLFFPQEHQLVRMVAAFMVFSAGFIMRPVGAVIFGVIGDRYGRKKAMTTAIVLMAIPTALIGLLPSYQSIGILAPILLTFFRLIQGLSMGGEIGGAMAFVLEHAPAKHRGLWGSLTFSSACIGIILGSVVASLLTHYLSPDKFAAWGWRLMFMFGIVVGIVGYYIRQNLLESQIYLEISNSEQHKSSPVIELIKNNKINLLIAMAINLSMAAPFLTLAVFISSYTIGVVKIGASVALWMNSVNIGIIMIMLPVSGYLSDLYGRKIVLGCFALLMLLVIYPIMDYIQSMDLTQMQLAQLALAVTIGLYSGPAYTAIVEIFKVQVRCSGVGLAMNLGTAIFCSTVPMVASHLLHQYGPSYSFTCLALYIMLCNLITIIAIYYAPETYQKPINQ